MSEDITFCFSECDIRKYQKWHVKHTKRILQI